MTKILKQNKTEFSDYLWKTFNWFSTDFAQIVQDSCTEFFGFDIDLKLFSIGENDNVLFRGDKYFVTEIKITNSLKIGIRLSQKAINMFLDETLGTPNINGFSMEKLSELEVNIVNAFNEFLYSNLKKILKSERDVKNEDLTSLCYIVFYLTCQERDFGKLVLTIPTNILQPTLIETQEVFTLADFRRCDAIFKIKVGSSKIKLGEVRSLQVDDIILLENSNIYKMSISNNGMDFEFKISPNPSIILDTDDEGEDMGENTSVSNIWDNIQVDINAEFEKVKISLGELKQISEGLVVDIGSIYDNRIDLKVENKIVAKGELVIINDRYGVKIDEVVPSEPEPEMIQEETPYQEKHINDSSKNLNEEEFEDDDFNYDEFEDDEI